MLVDSDLSHQQVMHLASRTLAAGADWSLLGPERTTLRATRPVLAVVSLSAIYEIIETRAARVVDPEVGMTFLDAQGDLWDGQKDVSLALAGAIIAMTLTACYGRGWGHEPYQGLGGPG